MRLLKTAGPDCGGERYPRVLLVYAPSVHESDQHGLLIRNLFSQWPKAHLAQIFSGMAGQGETFCEKTFQLGVSERRLGSFFFRLKTSTFAQSSQPVVLNATEQLPGQHVKKTALFRSAFSKSVLTTGLWELIFAPRLSESLVKWVEDFSPQVIYCQGYNLAFCWLPLMLNARFNIPIVFHTTDDWPDTRYRQFPPMHWLIRRVARRLVHRASARIAVSEKMANAYQRQFGVPFDIVMNFDDYERFAKAGPQRVVGPNTVSVVYTGALSPGRWQALADLCDAAVTLGQEGFRIKITAFTSSIPTEAINVLRNRPNLQLLPPLNHDQVPQFLKGADILFLPEKLEPKAAKTIRYSISSKAQLYMMSERPILVYGSPIAGVVDYAKREKWAYIVEQRSNALLVDALRQLIADSTLRSRLVSAGLSVALRNHDMKETEPFFLNIIQSASQRFC